ncbi:flavin reductase family protein [Acuticoccus sediminis]|uniref:flavin reductase family protein n=1 Tax=Acuticoccus sediminis TaxID=2184697 RepID=UPI001CFDB52B|nr:flavin reductase family protein [Acuticoccus sediminis]
MQIIVTDDGHLRLDDPRDFKRFSVGVRRRGAGAERALRPVARIEGEHAWVRPDDLRRLSPHAGEADWEAGFAAMIGFARKHGWIDAEGCVRAHIEERAEAAAEPAPAVPVEAGAFKSAMRNLAGGVTVVATGAGRTRLGLTATAVTSVSADPPSLLVCVNSASGCHDAILANGVFSVNLLRDCDDELALRFAGLSGLHGADRFDDARWRSGAGDVPLLADALCTMACALVSHHTVGSHGIFIGRVTETTDRPGHPLVNFQGRLLPLVASAPPDRVLVASSA